MNASEALRFKQCEIDIQRRELRFGGALRRVEPRVFDLLVYLIQQRHRVVARDELLTQLWGPGCHVSASVINHTLMKARKAVGDLAGSEALIRTVHRVGYRFVGVVESPVQTRQSAPAEARASGGTDAVRPMRLGCLPFVNHTGEDHLAWLELGLPEAVGQTLESDGRIALTATTTLAALLRDAAADSANGELAQNLVRLLSLDCLVAATVVRHGQRYRLDYHAEGQHAPHLQGSVMAPEPAQLAALLSAQIESQLFPGAPIRASAPLSDPFANENFARALRAFSQEHWQSAANLLRVVLDLEPASLVVGVEYTRTLAAMHEPAVFSHGQNLLQQLQLSADEPGHARLAARLHQALGQAHLNIHGPGRAAKAHLRAALDLAKRHGDTEWATRIAITQARYELSTRQYAGARQLCEQVLRATAESGNRLLGMLVLNTLALVDVMSGNLLSARRHLEQSLAVSSEMGMAGSSAISGVNLARADADLGFVATAATRCEALLEQLPLLQEDRAAAGVMLAICSIYADTDAVILIDRTLEALQRRVRANATSLEPELTMALALRAAATGQFERACQLMRKAAEALRRAGSTLMLDQWLPVLLHLELRAGHHVEARAILAELQAIPTFNDDDLLQGVAAYAQALMLHALGEVEQAAEGLLEAVRLLPISKWNAYARLDAAWLHIERGEPLAARRLLRDIQPWTREHPIGLLVLARLQHSQGEAQTACDLQEQFLTVAGDAATAFQHALLPLYRRGARCAIPRSPSLPAGREAPWARSAATEPTLLAEAPHLPSVAAIADSAVQNHTDATATRNHPVRSV